MNFKEQIFQSLKEEHHVQRGILFMSEAFQRCNKNSKPVVLHSIRTGFMLWGHGHSPTIVIAALLHDVLEDTATTEEEIRKEFGEEICRYVRATTIDESITGKEEQDFEMFFRCVQAGREALLIKCADILDNTQYIVLLTADGRHPYRLHRIERFLELSAPYIAQERVWTMLAAKLQDLRAAWGDRVTTSSVAAGQ